MAKTVALDFDGVMNTYDGWKGEDFLFDPRPGLKEFLVELKKEGYRCVIYSTRTPEKIEAWLEQHGLRKLVGKVSNQKPMAHVYLDDRGLTFKGDFNKALGDIKSFKVHWEKK